jgi:DNA-binding transcriptional LysR family regulator
MNLRQFDLNLLVALDVLLTERNVTRAGERLFLSQPAMSGILARLRHAFQDELLVRVGRNLEPTAFAAELAGPVHECVQQLEDLLNQRRSFAPESASWSFQIAASDYVVFLVLGPLLRSVTAIAPNVSVRFVSLEPTAADRLAAGDIDFAVLPSEIEPSLPSVPLFEDSWICAVWSRHAHTKDRFTIDEFLALPHLSFRLAGPDHGSVAENYFTELGCERRIVVDRELRHGAVPIARDAASSRSCRGGWRAIARSGRHPAHRAAFRSAATAREAHLEPALYGQRRAHLAPHAIGRGGQDPLRSLRGSQVSVPSIPGIRRFHFPTTPPRRTITRIIRGEEPP